MFDQFLIIILVALSAFFSGSETALFSLSRAQVRLISNRSKVTGPALAKLLSRPRRVLTTILIGNLIVNIALTSFLATFFTEKFGTKGLGFAVLASTILLLFFGEIFPKVLGIYRARFFSRLVSLPLLALGYLLTPLRILIRFFTNILLWLLNQPISDADPILTKQAFESTLIAGKLHGGIEANEAEIIHSISSFYSTSAHEIMIPRPEMKCIDSTASIKKALALIANSPQYLLPIFEGNRDNIIAILNTKYLSAWRLKISFNQPMHQIISKIIESQDTPPCFFKPMVVPEIKYIDAIFTEMNQNNQVIAILLDEYGGTAGMISKSIIINFLLGGMINPQSRTSLIHVLASGAVVAAGDIRIKQLNWDCNCHLPDEEITLAGYLLKLLGIIPKAGDSIEDEQHRFKVLQMKNNRIKAVRVTRKTGEFL